MNISTAQRKIYKVIKVGGCIVLQPRGKRNLRLIDANKNPLKFVHKRTFDALIKKELITKTSNTTFGCVGADENILTEETNAFTQLQLL